MSRAARLLDCQEEVQGALSPSARSARKHQAKKRPESERHPDTQQHAQIVERRANQVETTRETPLPDGTNDFGNTA
jgi:hypothetical protein